MSNNTQLPAEVLALIDKEASDAMEKENERLQSEYPEMGYGLMLHQVHGFQDGYRAGATEYAINLHQVEQENKQACDAAKLMTNKNNECQAKLWDAYRENEKARDLLKEIISVCGDTLIHHTSIANEIKQFLDGK